VPQATAAGAEVLAVSDGPDLPTEAVTRRHRAGRLELPRGSGANAARNAGVAAARGELIVFVDDDVEVAPGWLQALLAGARGAPEIDVFGGPIIGRLEGGGPRCCGAEPPPITTLDLGPVDREVDHVWSANMAIRDTALARIGPFDESIRGRGEEEDWQRRYAATGGRIRYLAAAGLVHRRDRRDARLRRLALSAYALGRTARRYDRRKQTAPSTGAELRAVAGGGWHAARRGCAYGLVFAAHGAGRLREALAERPT
jgi:GT2 family glycosyltransferase